jgi:hypothetical protein
VKLLGAEDPNLGKWRFEIDDSKAKINRNAIPIDVTPAGSEVYRLGDVFEHPTLYNDYPALADYNIELLKGKNVTGDLSFNFEKKQKTQGQISGEFIGDTLFVDYNFKIDGNAYKNPQVFLKKDKKLLQGSGELEVYLGRTYFKKGIPINFDKGFVFQLSDCK